MLVVVLILACSSCLSYGAVTGKKVADDKFSQDLQAALDSIPFEKLPDYFKMTVKEDKYSNN
jgi:hypothetical protein